MTLEKTSVRLLLMVLIIAAGLCLPALTGHVYAAKTPAKPAGVKVTDVKDTSCQVSWKTSKNANSYIVQYKKKAAKKWKGYKFSTPETFADLNSLNSNTRYQVRVKAVNGKKMSSWSSVKTFATKLQPPRAVWAEHIGSSSITIRWIESKDAKKYKITWYQDNPSDDGSDPVKYTTKTSCTFDSLAPEGYFHFSVQAVKDKKTSPGTAIGLGTYSEESGITMDVVGWPASTRVELTRFISGHEGFPGSEWELPALYRTDYDSEGDVTEDGYYFVDAYLQKVTLYYGTMKEYNKDDVAHPLTKKITGETTYKIGDTFTRLDGKTGKITELRLVSEPNEVFDGCEDHEDAYDRIDNYELYIKTDIDGLYDPTITWTPWHSGQ